MSRKENMEAVLQQGEQEKKEDPGGSRIISLEQVDKRHTCKGQNCKFILMAAGERKATIEKEEINYVKMNCVQIRGPGKKTPSGDVVMDIPILEMSKFLVWRELPEHKKYFNDLKNSELESITTIQGEI